ncbi:MAG: cation diffusion facilitator family transporter [Legionellaceae bacterium]|nr:cation diffusion facilitator family transporter [Legionellaceae bacterium]
MGAGHQHIPTHSNNERVVLIPLLLTGGYFVVEAVGGVLTGSLALISDAAHMLTDVTALLIAFVAIKLSKKPADDYRTFGYHRFEILAAALNTILLLIVAIYILYEAYLRINQPPDIQSMGMLLIASVGLLVNIISMWLLNPGKNHNLNLKGAYLEVWSDALGSVGVIISALMIQFLGWHWVDSLIAILIGLWILPRTWALLKASMNILLEGVPDGIELKQLKNLVCALEGVQDIHELHVWAISSHKISLTAHIVIDKKISHEALILAVNSLLKSEYNIAHTTLQVEYQTCLADEKNCYFNH